MTPDRYDRARLTRIRLCRTCGDWLPIGAYDWAYNAERRRRRTCRECRNESEVHWSRAHRARRRAAA